MNPLGKARVELAAIAFLLGVQLALVARAGRNLDRVRAQWRAERAAYAALEDRVDEARRFLAPAEGPAEVVTLVDRTTSPVGGTVT